MKVTTVFAMIATLLTQSPAVAENYYMLGYGRIDTTEPGFKYGSSNLVGLMGTSVSPYLDLEGEFSFPVAEDYIMISGTRVDIGVRHIGGFVRIKAAPSESLSVFARLGYVKGTASASVGSTKVEVDESAAAYGVGVEFGDKSGGFRLDLTMVDWDSVTESSLVSFGWVGKF